MKFDKKAEIYISEPIPNGYGGFVDDIQLYGIVDVALTPFHYDMISAGNVIKTLITCKLFTKSPLPKVVHHVVVEGVTYYVQLYRNLGKVHALNLELDGRIHNG